MKAHTPGPWTVKCLGSTRCNRAGYIDANNVHVGYAYRDKSHMHVGEAEANARLIAAGPDMLEALKEARAQLQYMREVMQSVGSFYPNADSECESRLAVIEAAISKAEGGTDEEVE